MTLGGLCIMTLPVHACGGHSCFCCTVLVGEMHPAPELLNISCGARAETKQSLWVRGWGEVKLGHRKRSGLFDFHLTTFP